LAFTKVTKLGFKEENVRIYIVDDDSLLLRIMKHKFETSTKYQLYTFETGEEFLDHFIKNPPTKKNICIVLLDYYLKNNENPDARDGIEILKYIKEINPAVHVIMHSGDSNVELAEKSMSLGARTFIKKNENSFLRFHNQIKAIISDYLIEQKKKNSKITQYIFGTILILVLILMATHFLTD
jgi:DNA-binding NtrC family response regulator